MSISFFAIDYSQRFVVIDFTVFKLTLENKQWIYGHTVPWNNEPVSFSPTMLLFSKKTNKKTSDNIITCFSYYLLTTSWPLYEPHSLQTR